MHLAETDLHLTVEAMSEQLTINGLLRRFEAMDRVVCGASGRRPATAPQGLPPGRSAQDRVSAVRKRVLGEAGEEPAASAHDEPGRAGLPAPPGDLQSLRPDLESFRRAVGLEPRQRASEELREKLVGLVTELSYRKASRFGEEQFGGALSAMEIWRNVQRRARDISFTADGDGPARLEVDGTQAPAGPDAHGEAVNLAFQVGDRRQENGRWRRNQRLVGLGMSDWSQALPEALAPDLVVNDGGGDFCRAVAATYPEARFQRCEWHLVYGLDKTLWNDGVKYQIRGRLQRELHEQVFGPGEGRDRRADIRA